MNLVIFIFVVVCGILLFRVLWRSATSGVVLSDNGTEENCALDGLIEMEDAFFEAVLSGKKAVKFMHLFYRQDVIILKSMFQSEGIPYKTENEHLPSILVGQCVVGFNHTDFYILKEDYNDAFALVKAYAEHKKTHSTSDLSKKTASLALMTMVFASSYIPDKDETSGIVVFKLEE